MIKNDTLAKLILKRMFTKSFKNNCTKMTSSDAAQIPNCPYRDNGPLGIKFGGYF
jgi:hypothetical protein